MFRLQRLFRCNKSLVRYVHKIDPIQEASLEEKCYLVDNNDNIIGTASKKECHQIIDDKCPPLHRAFSVFLFNKKGDLLLQKRSAEKVTYPGHYTNTCCSHPIADVAGESEEGDALGVKRAAQRRLNYELGIPKEQIEIDKFIYITRVLYSDMGDGQWGEHEIDYILFFNGDVTVKPNPNEISEISFVGLKDIDAFIPTLESPLTPWFQLILKYRLKIWWQNLDALYKYKEHNKIISFAENCKT